MIVVVTVLCFLPFVFGIISTVGLALGNTDIRGLWGGAILGMSVGSLLAFTQAMAVFRKSVIAAQFVSLFFWVNFVLFLVSFLINLASGSEELNPIELIGYSILIIPSLYYLASYMGKYAKTLIVERQHENES